MMTLEAYLRKHAKAAVGHVLSCRIIDDKVTFYIHPCDIDGETLDFLVDGNSLSPDPNVNYAPTQSDSSDEKPDAPSDTELTGAIVGQTV